MDGQAQEPTGGWFEGRTHVFPVRVYYEDTDFSGVVYHANYLRFMERGRSEFLRLAGRRPSGHVRRPRAAGLGGPAHEYRFPDRPARMEDALTVRTSVLELAGARMRLDQSGRRAWCRHPG